MVTSCGEFQVSGANVMVDGATEAAKASEPDTVKGTAAVGFESSTSLTEPAGPASDTVTELPDKLMPAVSTLNTSTLTSGSKEA